MKVRKKFKNSDVWPKDVYIECEVLHGLKSFTLKEINSLFGGAAKHIQDSDEESVKFFFSGEIRALLALRTVVAVYIGGNLRIPGPQALLLPHNFQYFVGLIKFVESLHSSDTFKSFRFSAAGEDSVTFKKLGSKITQAASLKYDAKDGGLLLRVRPTEYAKWGWDVLVRLSPRPLSVRPWRIENMPGAINATIASAMISLTNPQRQDEYVNLMCGSGTLLVERLMLGMPARVLGIDNNPASISAAKVNIKAAGFTESVELKFLDATSTGLPDSSFDKLVADLPWGQLIGTHSENDTLYPAILREAGRIAKPYADFIVLTHDITRFETNLETDNMAWKIKAVFQVSQGGKHPKIFHLKKSA